MELKGLKKLYGLDALITESKSDKLFYKEGIYHLAIHSLQSGKYQPRSEMDESSLKELASSIQSQGILLPLIVRLDEEKYEIIAGERRWRAAKMLGLETVPAVIRNVTDDTALAFALIENIQRESLNSMDEALAFIRLRDQFSMTHEEIAERVGRSRSAVTNLMRLFGLSEEVKQLLQSKRIEMGHARALLSLSEQQQRLIAQEIVEKRLSVRDTEKLVKKNKNSVFISKNDPYHEKIIVWEKLLSDQLSTKVRINLNHQGNGKVIIHVNSVDKIDWLIRMTNI